MAAPPAEAEERGRSYSPSINPVGGVEDLEQELEETAAEPRSSRKREAAAAHDSEEEADLDKIIRDAELENEWSERFQSLHRDGRRTGRPEEKVGHNRRCGR